MQEHHIEYEFNGTIFKTETVIGSQAFYFYEHIHELEPVHESDLEYDFFKS